MSKAALVIEMPEKCADCPCKTLYGDLGYYVCEAGQRCGKKWGRVDLNSKPDWCPLVPLPEYDTESYFPDEYLDGYKSGWNACIDAICEKTHGNARITHACV